MDIKKILAELVAERERIDAAIRALGGVAKTSPSNGAVTPKRRRISAAGRQRIAAAQKKRWAAVKGRNPAKKAS
jgi:hypothetical protein